LAKQWWADQHKPLMDLGIDGWWTDLNEPEEHPQEMIHAGGIAPAVHNSYVLHMLTALKMAQEQHKPEGRLFIMSRSGWPGTQAMGAGQWSGDVATRWDALQNQIPLGLSMAMVGMAYWNTDIGGFAGEEPMPELYTRWIQFGAFTPIMRPHGAHQNREPWAFGDDVEEIVVEYIKLRYRLLPYTYNLAREANTTGLPFMRPLVLHYPQDRQTFNLRDQYLWGRDLLVAPVVTPNTTSRKVYLPAGEWFDFWTNRQVRGGRYVTAQAPLETLPLYVRAGAILPMAPDRLSTGGAWEALSVGIYPAEGTASYNLYEDDGLSTAFQGGAHALTTFSYTKSESGLQITIDGTQGSFAGQPAQRTYGLKVRLGRRPTMVTVGETTLKARRSLEGLERAATGWWFHQKLKVLHVKLAPTAITTSTQIQIG
jgi:alpha-glucosidase